MTKIHYSSIAQDPAVGGGPISPNELFRLLVDAVDLRHNQLGSRLLS